MTRIALIATLTLVAACGSKTEEAAPAADTTTVVAPAPAPAPMDSMATDTTKVDSAAMVDTTKKS
jgi:hypothetical protein